MVLVDTQIVRLDSIPSQTSYYQPLAIGSTKQLFFPLPGANDTNDGHFKLPVRPAFHEELPFTAPHVVSFLGTGGRKVSRESVGTREHSVAFFLSNTLCSSVQSQNAPVQGGGKPQTI